MKIRHLLVVAAAAVAVADASAFKWEPVSLYPSPSLDVTSSYYVENLSFQCYDAEGLQITDVMPVWVNDEDGKEIKATWGVQDDWNPNQFNYHFNLSDFNGNGDYVLIFPEGMLVNGDGDKSDKVEKYYTFVVPELAGDMFEDFEVLSVTPDLLQPQALWSDQVVTVNTNHNDAIGLTRLVITDTTTGDGVVFSDNNTTGRQLGDKTQISWEVVGSYKFFEDHVYKAEFTFFNGNNDYSSDTGEQTPIVAKKSYEFTGKVEGYKYSKLELWDVLPTPYSLISEPSQAVFTYTFSGPVNVYRVSTPRGNAGDPIVYPASCISSNIDKTVWTIDLSKDEYVNSVDAQLTLQVYARDLDGYQLKGNEGEEDLSCFENNWECELGTLPLVVVTPKDGENISRLTEVVVKAENGEPITWSFNGQASVENSLGIPVGYLEIADDLDGSATEVHFTQWYTDDSPFELVPIDLSVDGAYTIKISNGAFNFGEQFDEHKSHSVESKFFIGNKQLQYASVDPENGSTVKKLDQIIMKFSEPVICDNFQVDVCNTSRSVITTAIVRPDNMEPTWIIVDFANPVTEAGNYYLVVPEGKIESETQTNSAFTLTYIVDPHAGDDPGIDPAEQEVFFYDTVSPESGSTVVSLEVINLSYPDPANTMGKDAIVYNKADQSVVTDAQVLYDFDDWNMIHVELLDPVTEAGEYEIVIPRGAICSDEFFETDGKKGICNPEIRLSYTVDPNGADDPVDPQEALEYYSVYPEVGSEVKSLDTIVLTFVEPVACEDFAVNVYNEDGDVVSTGFGRSDFSDSNRIVVDLNEPVAVDGKYMVVIPNHVIVNGDYYESDGVEGLCNPEYKLYYTVVSNGSDDPVDPSAQEVFNYTQVDPVDGSTVNELSHISLWFPDVVVTTGGSAYVYKADAVDAEPLSAATVNWDFIDDFLIKVDLVTPISENGEYVVVIPARTICDDAFFGSDGASGICNPEIRLHYTVDNGSAVASVVEISNCDVFDLQGNLVLRNASSDQLKSLSKGIYVVAGKKVVIK